MKKFAHAQSISLMLTLAAGITQATTHEMPHHALVSSATLVSHADNDFKTLSLTLTLDKSESLKLAVLPRAPSDVAVTLKIVNPQGQSIYSGNSTAIRAINLGTRPAGDYRLEFAVENSGAVMDPQHFSIHYSGGTLQPLGSRSGREIQLDYAQGLASQKLEVKAIIDSISGDGLAAQQLQIGDIISAEYWLSVDAALTGNHSDNNARYDLEGDANVGQVSFKSPSALQGLTTDHFSLNLQDRGNGDSSLELFSANERDGSPLLNQEALFLSFMSIAMNNGQQNQATHGGNNSIDPVQAVRKDKMLGRARFHSVLKNCADNSQPCQQEQTSYIGARMLSIASQATSSHQVSYSPYEFCLDQAEWQGGRMFIERVIGGNGELALNIKHFTARTVCTLPNVGRTIKTIELLGSDSIQFVESPWAQYGDHYEGYGCKVLLNQGQALNPNQTLTKSSIAYYGVSDTNFYTDSHNQRHHVVNANQANISCHWDVGTRYDLGQIVVSYDY